MVAGYSGEANFWKLSGLTRMNLPQQVSMTNLQEAASFFLVVIGYPLCNTILSLGKMISLDLRRTKALY